MADPIFTLSVHQSHQTRLSDASSYDEICQNCGATDAGDKLEEPCPKANEVTENT